MQRGNALRTTHATEVNDVSSRSHSICQIQLKENSKLQPRGGGQKTLHGTSIERMHVLYIVLSGSIQDLSLDSYVLSIDHSIYLSMYNTLSIVLSIVLSIYLSIYLSLYLSIDIYIYIYICSLDRFKIFLDSYIYIYRYCESSAFERQRLRIWIYTILWRLKIHMNMHRYIYLYLYRYIDIDRYIYCVIFCHRVYTWLYVQAVICRHLFSSTV
jgi:hypothetical protein